MTEIKAILFDMDGVLIDAREWHYDALNRALGLFGMEISRYDHLVTYDGLPTWKKLEMISSETGLSNKLHPFIKDLKQKYTMELIQTNCKPRFQHEYALSILKKEGYKIALASNSIRKTIELMITKASIKQYLEFYISAEDCVLGKPDPEIYVESIKKLGLKPEECLIIEDNENGKKAALASGAHLMEVEGVEDVNYSNIVKEIKLIEGRD